MRSFSSASPRSVAPANKTPSLLGSASTSVTRRSAVAVLALTAAPLSVLAAANNAHAQASQAMPEKSLYERLGGVFAIAAVVDHFSDAVVCGYGTPRIWEDCPASNSCALWVCNVSGGPFRFEATKPGKTPLGLEEAHRNLRISPAEFDEVAAELGRTLDYFKVPQREKAEVLAAFAAHKDEVTAGYVATTKPR